VLQRIIERLHTLQEYITDVKDVCTRISRQTDTPEPWVIVLPVFYKRMLERNDRTQEIDPNLVVLGSMYLGRRFPELSGYFRTERVMQDAEALMREVLEYRQEYCAQHRQDDGTRAGPATG
jgi:hypothetical protein